MSTTSAQQSPVYSCLGADPELAEIVEMFVEDLPERIDNLVRLYDAGDHKKMVHFAHRMKGAAGSYGFDQITPYAARLEVALRDRMPAEEICGALAELNDICSRVRAGASV